MRITVLLLGFLLVLVVTSAIAGVLLYQRHAALARLEAGGMSVETAPAGPRWLSEKGGAAYAALIWRVVDFDTGLDELDDRHLADLARLGANPSSLDLADANVSDEGLRALRSFQGLRSLDLSGTPAGDAGMRHVASLTQLSELTLDGSRVGDAGVAEFTTLTHLNDLSLERTAIGDEALASLAQLGALEYLSLSGTSVTGRTFSHLAALENLKGLYLADTQLEPASVAALQGLRGLSHLSLAGTAVDDLVLDSVVGITSLEYINLSRTQVTESGAARLRAALPEALILHGSDGKRYGSGQQGRQDSLLFQQRPQRRGDSP